MIMKKIIDYKDLDEYIFKQLQCGNVIIGDKIEVEVDFNAYKSINDFISKGKGFVKRYSTDINELYIRGIRVKLVETAGGNWKDLLALEDKQIYGYKGSWVQLQEDNVLELWNEKSLKGFFSGSPYCWSRAHANNFEMNINPRVDAILENYKQSVLISNGATGVWCDRDFTDRSMYQIMGYACTELGIPLGVSLWDKCNETNMKIGAGKDFEKYSNIVFREIDGQLFPYDKSLEKEYSMEFMNEPKEFRPKYDKLNNIQKKARKQTNRKHKKRRK